MTVYEDLEERRDALVAQYSDGRRRVRVVRTDACNRRAARRYRRGHEKHNRAWRNRCR
jgi:hypothetical protein